MVVKKNTPSKAAKNGLKANKDKIEPSYTEQQGNGEKHTSKLVVILQHLPLLRVSP